MNPAAESSPTWPPHAQPQSPPNASTSAAQPSRTTCRSCTGPVYSNGPDGPAGLLPAHQPPTGAHPPLRDGPQQARADQPFRTQDIVLRPRQVEVHDAVARGAPPVKRIPQDGVRAAVAGTPHQQVQPRHPAHRARSSLPRPRRPPHRPPRDKASAHSHRCHTVAASNRARQPAGTQHPDTTKISSEPYREQIELPTSIGRGRPFRSS